MPGGTTTQMRRISPRARGRPGGRSGAADCHGGAVRLIPRAVAPGRRAVPPSRSRVERAVEPAHGVGREVRVDLGRPDVGVPEKGLHRPEVGSALEEVARERVAERVGKAAAEPRARAPAPGRSARAPGGRAPGPARSRRAPRGRRPGRAAGAPAPDSSATARRAASPIGTSRCRSRLPRQTRICAWRSTSAGRSPTELGRAEPRAVEQLQHRAITAGEERVASPGDSTSAVASRFESALGSRRGSRGVSRSAAGFSRSRSALRPNR